MSLKCPHFKFAKIQCVYLKSYQKEVDKCPSLTILSQNTCFYNVALKKNWEKKVVLKSLISIIVSSISWFLYIITIDFVASLLFPKIHNLWILNSFVTIYIPSILY